MSTQSPFVINPDLTGIAIAYHNKKMIADGVLPRYPVGKQDFKYTAYNKDERFTLPDTKVGRRSDPNQVEFGATEVSASTDDWGLDDVVPQVDIDNATAGMDPLGTAVEGIVGLVELDREKRVADLVFNAATYPTANKLTLSGFGQWSDFVNSDPIADITAALDTPVFRPNVMTIGRPAYSVLIRHPKVLKAVHGNAGDSGIAARQAIADLFELDEILVGDAWINTAKKGQAATMVRLWGKHCAFTVRNAVPRGSGAIPTFGGTAQFGTRIAGTIGSSTKGLRGSTIVRAGESVKELVMAADLGYFIQNAVA